MKTILIPVFNGQVARNIFQTDVYKRLSEDKEIRIIFIVPAEKVDYYQSSYGKDNVEFVEYSGKNADADSRSEKIWSQFLFHSVDTPTVYVKIRMNYLLNKNYLRWAHYRLSMLVTKLLSQLDWLKKMFRYFYFVTLKIDGRIIDLVDRYKPDLIYAPNIYDYYCIQFLKIGKIRKIRTVSTVNSWDNLSTKGMVPIVPDRLLVQNEYMRDEAVEDHMVDDKRIFVTGVPQFDYYHGFVPWPKEEFYKRLGITDLNKRIILFGPAPHKFGNPYWDVLRYLDRIISNDPALADFVVLVRFYPNDVVDISSFIAEHGLSDRHHLYYSLPTTNSFGGGVNWEFNREDMLLLANSLYYSDQVINYGSTLTIDAAAFDKPSINIAFDGDLGQIEGGFQWVFDKTHILELLKTKGTRVINNYEELEFWLTQYANDPTKDASGRKAIRERFSYKLDGLSSERLAGFILNLIK